MDKKTMINKDLIGKIIIIKANLFFVIIFVGAMLHSADMLAEAILIREIFFWVAIILIFMFQCLEPFRRMLDFLEEIINRKKNSKRDK